ncbi:MAG: J domain-containing protein [Alphaproteobacteria bacterium]|nr:J domain-containing protein [Alphaproteobacteria bacterium]MCB9695840.1 J domain-containing protein [Alphaproteobacteria bacterium]
MPPQISRVDPDAFGTFLHATPYALLRLERTGPIEFHRGVAEFFDGAWPRLFSFGALERARLREPSWLDQVFRTSLGPMRGGIHDGYWLFERGLVVGHHRGVVSTGVSYDGVDHERQRQRVVRYGFAGVGARADVVEAARQICVYFDDIVTRKLGAKDEGEGSYTRETRESAHRAPPPRAPAPPPAEDDPYEILGVDPSISDDDLKAAYKQQMKLNHPDKVAHMSPALQKFAQEQTVAIQKAYERILRSRG